MVERNVWAHCADQAYANALQIGFELGTTLNSHSGWVWTLALSPTTAPKNWHLSRQLCLWADDVLLVQPEYLSIFWNLPSLHVTVSIAEKSIVGYSSRDSFVVSNWSTCGIWTVPCHFTSVPFWYGYPWFLLLWHHAFKMQLGCTLDGWLRWFANNNKCEFLLFKCTRSIFVKKTDLLM